MTNDNPFSSILDIFNPSSKLSSSPSNDNKNESSEQLIKSFISSLNSRTDPTNLMQYFDDDINYIDTSYYNPIKGKDALLKHFYLHAGSSPLSSFKLDSREESIVIDDIVSSNNADGTSKVCVMYHLITQDGKDIPDTTAISFYNIQQDGNISSLNNN